jgi:capsular exopolysaccharide synthesis family protein
MEREYVSGADQEAQSTTHSLALWQTIRRRKVRILICAAVFIALAVLYHQSAGPWYESTGQVLVLKKHLDTSPILGGSNADTRLVEDYLPTHMLIISSPRVVHEAVAKNDLVALENLRRGSALSKLKSSISKVIFGEQPPGDPQEGLTKSIIGSLRVTSDVAKPGAAPSREVMNVAFEGRDASECNVVLKAVIAAYQEFLKDTFKNVNAETRDLIARARDASLKDLESKEAAYRRFRAETPLIRKGNEGGGNTVAQDRLFAIDAKRSALRMRHAEIQATLSAIDNALKQGRSYAELMEMVSGLPTNRDLLVGGPLSPETKALEGTRDIKETLEQQLVNLQLEEQRLMNQGLGTGHPQILAIRDRIESVRSLVSPPTGGQPLKPEQTAWIETFVKLKRHTLKQELSENERAIQSLTALFSDDQKDANQSRLYAIEEGTHISAIERSRLVFETIEKRLVEIDTVKDYVGFDTHVIASPDGKLFPKKYMLVFGGALFLGLLLGFGWACLAEMKDKSFRNAGEVRRLGLPVLGQIPFFRRARRAETKESLADPIICTHHRPASVEAEAYRGVRTVLFYARRAGTLNGAASDYIFNDGLHLARGAETQNVLQITSPGPGDGKTTLAANLAVTIAQSGKRVLLIDADFRRPRLHALFGLENQVGLATLLAGQTSSIAEAVQETSILGLSVLPSGKLPTNPADLLTSPRLREVIEWLRPEHDFVLIDTPPVLAVTDPCAVAPQVRAVLLTIRNSKHARPDTEEARSRLESLGANVLGVVVNCVHDLVGYAKYGYGSHVTQAIGE